MIEQCPIGIGIEGDQHINIAGRAKGITQHRAKERKFFNLPALAIVSNGRREGRHRICLGQQLVG